MKKILLASALLLGVSFTSCNSYLDINTDPNSPAEENVETSMLMPAIEMNTASSYWLIVMAKYLIQKHWI